MKDAAAVVILILSLLYLAHNADVKRTEDYTRKFNDCYSEVRNVNVCEEHANNKDSK